MSARDKFRQITMLCCPFPGKVIRDNPGGGNRGRYVPHHVVEQRILEVVGPVDYAVTTIVRGDTKDGNHKDVVVGVLATMTATIDGATHTVTEAGDCEQPGNWPHDGARLKDASSDAYKRCAMRLAGVGLHLWAGEDFYLFGKLRDIDDPPAVGGAS
jgi:hypothetical protein